MGIPRVILEKAMAPIMEGKLDGVVEALITYEQQKMLSVADQDE